MLLLIKCCSAQQAQSNPLNLYDLMQRSESIWCLTANRGVVCFGEQDQYNHFLRVIILYSSTCWLKYMEKAMTGKSYYFQGELFVQIVVPTVTLQGRLYYGYHQANDDNNHIM